MKQVEWISWDECAAAGPAERVYLGEETCIERLPDDESILAAVSGIVDRRAALTLVLPFVPETSFRRVAGLLALVAGRAGMFELVCNDWGVLRLACDLPGCVPVVGRLLNRQDCDPRVICIGDDQYQSRHQHGVRRLEWSPCRLQYQPPPPELLSHYRRCSLDRPQVYRRLEQLGVRRLEVSNLLQGIELSPPPGWRVTLHVPWVLVTVSRFCPEEGESFEDRSGRCPGNCRRQHAWWRSSALPCPLVRFGNALYYRHAELPPMPEDSGIDRIVHRDAMIPRRKS